jgi:hypothetical protein
MNPRASTIALSSLLCLLAVFVGFTSSALPEIVASHFGATGAANGYMPRGMYRAVMLLLIVGVPLLLAFIPTSIAGPSGTRLNIPRREYWLAPERRESTFAYIGGQARWFAALVAVFLGYVHWLVVRANRLQPPELSTAGLLAGLIAFFLLLAIWLASLWSHFRRGA